MTIKVKPLVWEPWRSGELAIDHVTNVTYGISPSAYQDGRWFLSLKLRVNQYFPDKQSAKDFVQSLHEARLLPAIEAVDPATIRAEADAIGDLGDDISFFPQATERGLHIKAYAIRERLIALIDKEQDQ